MSVSTPYLRSIKAKTEQNDEGVALKTLGRHERGKGRGCRAERGDGLQDKTER